MVYFNYLIKQLLFFLLQHVNKGMTSYRDPVSGPGRGQKTLHVTGEMDLTKLFVRTLRELGDPGAGPGESPGSSLQAVDRQIRTNFVVEVIVLYSGSSL